VRTRCGDLDAGADCIDLHHHAGFFYISQSADAEIKPALMQPSYGTESGQERHLLDLGIFWSLSALKTKIPSGSLSSTYSYFHT
jgi:hypothetical protein